MNTPLPSLPRFRVHTGYTPKGRDRWITFPNLTTANQYCETVRRARGVILSVVAAPVRPRYYLTATRPTGEPLFFCNSATQGPAMVPSAHSMAYLFPSRKGAMEAAAHFAPSWKGLANWKTNRV